MISKKDAKDFVLKLTVASLRRYAGRLRTADVGMKATQKDVEKVKAEMTILADKLEKKLGRVVEGAVVPEHLKEKDNV